MVKFMAAPDLGLVPTVAFLCTVCFLLGGLFALWLIQI
jgi:hypothetical protein